LSKGAQAKTPAQNPTLYILSAPSGGGKSSLARALVERCDDMVTSVSHTTRPLRPGETDSVDYFFVDQAVFEQMVEDKELLEYARVFDHYYGTSRETVEQALAQGRSVILDIDWQGARQARHAFPAAVSVYILPPSVEVLAKRLAARGRETPEEIALRLSEAASEMSHHDEYDHILINAGFDAALGELEALVRRGKAPESGQGFDVGALVDCAKNVRLKTSKTADL
jgi:guanylate kinase|tara:strand:- start:26657 stop:27334 length:678 start_codon:yes stop_codon:yes gene_type:complete